MSLADLFAARVFGLPLALLAGLAVALTLFRLGRDRFSPPLFAAALGLGGLSIIPVAGIEQGMTPLFVALGPFGGQFVKAFAAAGGVEEGAKLLFAYYFVRRHYLARTPRDVLLGAGAVPLGFALVENVGYVAKADGAMASVAMLRAVTSAPCHVFTGLWLGLVMARTQERAGFARFWRLMALGWAPAAVMHGLYDFPLFLLDTQRFAPQVIEAATRLGAAPSTMLTSAFTLAVALQCAVAAFVVRACNRMPLGESADYVVPPMRPRWAANFVQAPETGGRVGFLLLMGCAAALLIAAQAMFAGALGSTALNALRFCLAPALLAWALAAAPGAEASAPFVQALRRDRIWAGAACLIGLGVALIPNAPRNALIANTLAESGVAWLTSDEPQRAVADFSAALAYRPDHRFALAARASVRMNDRDFTNALADADHLVDLDPRDISSLSLRSQAHQNLHDYAKAKIDYDMALGVSPGDSHLLSQRANVLRSLGLKPDAARDIAAAIKANPKDAEPYQMRAEFALDDADMSAAFEALEAGAKLNPLSVAFTRGRALYLRGEYSASLVSLQSIAQGGDPYVAIWLYLAQSRSGVDGAAALKQAFARAPKTRWPYPVVRALLGEIGWDAARSLAGEVGQTCEADFYAGEHKLAHGERDSALAALRRAAATCPPDFVEYSGARIEARNLAASRSGS